MSMITLHSMKCEKLQDSISEDEIEVFVDGESVIGPIGIHKGQTVQFGGVSRSFTGAVAVELLERDSNSRSDSLGRRVVGDEKAGSGKIPLNFDAASKALYTVTYSVI